MTFFSSVSPKYQISFCVSSEISIRNKAGQGTYSKQAIVVPGKNTVSTATVTAISGTAAAFIPVPMWYSS